MSTHSSDPLPVDEQQLSEALRKIQAICDESTGRSQLFRSGSQGHLNSIRHHYETSSQDARFSVEPGSADDLSKIMQVIKAHPVPFAVKGGGHTSNPGFSSTEGIQISMSRFNRIAFNDDKTQLTVGAGCTFDEIYKFVRPHKRNIVGGAGNVGIGGWMMGGGFSNKTNQFGLGIDNLVQATVVLPDGRRVVTASDRVDRDLFWAIRGGGNNFGIVTEFVLETHRQGTNANGFVYGGILTYNETDVERVKVAILEFIKRDDPKANIEAAFRFFRNQGTQEFKFTVFAFYDDEKPQSDPFQGFLDITPHQGELKNSSYTKLDTTATLLYEHVQLDVEASTALSVYGGSGSHERSFPGPVIGLSVMNARSRWGNVMVSGYTQGLINSIGNEAKEAEKLMKDHNGRMVVYEIWPFLPTMHGNSVDSAWPHGGEKPNEFLLVYFMWEDQKHDDAWIEHMKASLGRIYQTALNEGCATPNAPVYCNTTLDNTTPQQIYQNNLTDLSTLRTKYDPDNVMKWTGGFRIPFGPAIVENDYRITRGNDAIDVRADNRVVKVYGQGAVFKISRVDGATEPEAYHIRFGDKYATDDEGNISVSEDATTWKIIPESRKDNQLEYSIANLKETKRWVLRGKQVKCVSIVESPSLEALWRFNLGAVVE